jgi:signal transduction histidine kinase
LLLNAVQALEANSPSDRILHVGVFSEDFGVGVEVTDNGPGVPTEVAPRIFEPFFSTKTPDSLGLGLAIARRLTLVNGGKLWHDANFGVGARFRSWFPAAD